MGGRAFSTVAVAVCCLGASAGPAAAEVETARLGATEAELSYERMEGDDGFLEDIVDLRVRIFRQGRQVADHFPTPIQDNGRVWPRQQVEGEKSIRVVDLENDGEPEVIADLFWGGANCCFYSIIYRFDPASQRYRFRTFRPGHSFFYRLRRLAGDPRPELVSTDYRFRYKYGSNVDTPGPIQIWRYDDGELISVTRRFRRLLRRDAAKHLRSARRAKRQGLNTRGYLAAYTGDKYLLGERRSAHRRLRRALRAGFLKRQRYDFGPSGRRYISSLKGFLRRTGYSR